MVQHGSLLPQQLRPRPGRQRWPPAPPSSPLQRTAVLLFLAAGLLCVWQLHSSHVLTARQHGGLAGGEALEAAAPPPPPPEPPFEVVCGVFVTHSTPAPLIDAFRGAAAAHNARPGARSRVLVKFFVGRGGHPLQSSDPDGAGADVVAAPSPENMNGGKTFEWFQHAAKAYPSASFVFKCDTDTAVDWGALEPYLSDLRSSGDLSFVGHMNDWESCGHFSHCPPKGCRNMTGDCWVYMSGGFYGLSGALARRLADCPYAQANRVGPEDLVTGKGVKRCGDGTERVEHVRNGIAWCHSKQNTPAHVRNGTFPAGCGS